MTSLGTATLDLVGDGRQLDRDLATAKGKAKKFGESSKKMGFAIGAMTAPIIGAGGAALKLFADFEKQMAMVGAVSGATADQMVLLQEKAKAMGETTVFTATQSAEAMGFMAMAGMEVNDIVGGLPAVLQLASAAQIDLADAADIVTNTMAGFGLGVEDLGRVNDVMVTGFTSANTDLVQLGQAFKFVGPVAKSAGLGFEETTAALSLLGNAGIQSTMAGTALRGAITKLLKPTDEAQGILDELGITVMDTEGNMLPLVDIIGQLETSGITTAQAMGLFGQRAGPAMLALVSQGSAALAELTTKMEESGGAAQRISDAQLNTLSGRMTLLKSAVEGSMLALGEGLVPVLEKLMVIAMPIINAVTKFAKEHETLTLIIFAAAIAIAVLAVGLIALGFIIPILATGFGVLSVAAGVLGGAMTIALGPVGLIILAIAGLVVAGILLWKNWAVISKKAKEIWGNILKFLKGLWDTIVNLFKDNWQLILAILFPAVGLPLLIAKHWGAIKDVMKNIWDGAVRVVKTAINNIIGLINSVIRAWNDLEFGVGPFTVGIGDFKRTIGPWTFGTPNIPTIPLLRDGGIATRATMAVLGEAGPEAIIPLDRLNMAGGAGGGITMIIDNMFGFDDFANRVREVGLDDDRGGREVVIR